MPRFTLRMRWLSALAASVLALGGAAPARAQVGSDRYASVVMDAGSGAVLSAASADEPRYPASLTKMMTLYMLFEAMRDRRVSLDQLVPVSPWAASMSPTKLGLTPGSAITVEQAILGLVTKSANDAAAALGEMLGGDEERFAQMMTLRARALGMARTTFRNASGLPDPDQLTTARDMAVLARRLVQDFPVQYRYFSTPSFVFRGRTILNHQRMLETYPGADGLKTGWIRDSGHNLVTSALHGNVRMIGVVLGAGSSMERDEHMAMLLDAGFEQAGAPMVLARTQPAPAFRMPSIITAAQAAPSYGPAPLYSAPYSDAPPPGRYGSGYAAPAAAMRFAAAPPLRSYAAPAAMPFAPAPPPLRGYAVSAAAMPFAPAPPPPPRGYAVRLANVRGGMTQARVPVVEPEWRRMPERASWREPALRRMDRADLREPVAPRADRFRFQPIMVAPRVAPARPTEPRRDVRAARAAWQTGRYPG